MTSLPKSYDERRTCLERAGYNVFNLDGADVEIDLFTDIPPRVLVAPVSAAGEPGRGHPDLGALAAELYGPAHYVFLVKGRAAELSLAAALGETARTVIVTHGLFRSTERSLERHGARIELAHGHSPDRPTCDLDLDWLGQRLAAGGVGLVFLEPNNNGLGGQPLTLENLEAVGQLCRRHGVLLALDTTRLLTNVAALGLPVVETARRYTACADLFVSACAKELLVPIGGFAAVRSFDLERKIFLHAFQEGTLLEPVEACQRLAAGFEQVRREPDLIAGRIRQVQRLARSLHARGVPCPAAGGGHAVYISVDRLLSPSDPLRTRAFEAYLYLSSGVRAYVWPYPAFGQVMRLAVTIGRYSDEELDQAAEAIAAAFDRIDDMPQLTTAPGDALFEMKRRYAPA